MTAGMESVDGILHAVCRRDDAAGMQRLMEPLPPAIAQDVRTAPNVSAQAMRHEGNAAYFIRVDPVHIEVWTFRPATFDQAADLWARIDDAGTIDLDVARRVYTAVTGSDTSKPS